MQLDHYSTASQWLSALRKREVSARDVLDLHLDRFSALNSDINAVVRTQMDAARKRATALDDMAARGEWAGPLHGLPMTVKDTFDVSGLPATSGAKKYLGRPGNVPDAVSVARLKNAGAIVWGKTNTPYLAGDNQTFNTLFGTTNNPHDLSLTPGGSSGGSAAALACGMTPAELGSDIGGSLRLPAHFCGIYALKPTHGVISQRGHVPPEPGSVLERELNVVGPMARSLEDLKILYEVLSGRELPDIDGDIKGLRVALWCEEESFPLSGSCGDAVRMVARKATELGAYCTKAKPDIQGDHLLEVYVRLIVAVLAEDLPYWTRVWLKAMRPLAKLAMDDRPFSRAKWSVYATSRYRDWIKALEMREKLRHIVADFFASWDVILAPVSPVTAFAHDHKGGLFSRKLQIEGQEEPYVSYLTWLSLASACNLPSVVIPAMRSVRGLPVGVQIIGAEGCEAKVLKVASALDKVLGGFKPPADYP